MFRMSGFGHIWPVLGCVTPVCDPHVTVKMSVVQRVDPPRSVAQHDDLVRLVNAATLSLQPCQDAEVVIGCTDTPVRGRFCPG